MLFKRPFLDGIVSGEITAAFRRWTRPTVRAGGTLKTAVGVLAIDSIERVPPEAITEAEARRGVSLTGCLDGGARRPRAGRDLSHRAAVCRPGSPHRTPRAGRVVRRGARGSPEEARPARWREPRGSVDSRRAAV